MNGAVYSANLRLKSALFWLSKNLFIDAVSDLLEKSPQPHTTIETQTAAFRSLHASTIENRMPKRPSLKPRDVSFLFMLLLKSMAENRGGRGAQINFFNGSLF